MARLSGLASEHHLEGPGDAPRRRRGRKSKLLSQDVSTTGTKRAASPEDEDDISIKTKKTRRVKVDVDDDDELAVEEEEFISQSQASDTIHVAKASRTHRRHSEPPVTAVDDEEDGNTEATPPPATQPVHGLTPHLERLGSQQRFKVSRRSRMSMPAQFHITDVDEVEGPREVQFVPLTAVLGERAKRRLRRSHLSEEVNDIEHHQKDDAKLRKAYADVRRQLREMEQKYTELSLELEATRLGNIDMSEDQNEAYQEQLQVQLTDARKEIDDLRASSVFATSPRGTSELLSAGDLEEDNDLDEDMVLVEPEDLNLTDAQMETDPLPNGFFATRVLESSQVIASQVSYEALASIPETSQDSLIDHSQTDSDHVPERISDQATQRYENEIGSLTNELSQARGAMRLVTIKLQNMNIVQPGASVNIIITELKRALNLVVAEYERLFPGVTSDMTTSELLFKVVEAIKGMNKELMEKIALAEKYHQLSHMLRQQNNSLLDLQANTEQERDELDQLVVQLTESNNKKARDINELDERVTTLTETVDQQDETIRKQEGTIADLESHVAEDEVDKDRLRQSLNGYTEELQTMTETVTRLEQEHADEIAQKDEDHTARVQELETELDAETEARVAAEDDAAQKGDLINELEGRVEQMDEEFQALTADIQTLRERYEQESAARVAAEGQRDDYNDLAYERANEIENLTEIIQDLEKQITEFRANLETERTQREQTEADLDEANERIADLDARLHDAGIQANELRSKLFQLQQEKEEIVAELRADAEEAAATHQELLEAETQRREDAEQKIASLEGEIAGLETDLSNAEAALDEMTSSRDDLRMETDGHITKLDRQLEELRKKYAALESTSKSTIDSLQATITDLTNEVNALRTTIARLEDAAVEAEQQHADALADRDAIIADRDAAIEELEAENEKLMAEKNSLASRVEDEAVELLNIMDSHDHTRKTLEDTIRVQTATIAQLHTNNENLKQEYEAELETKNQEIEALTILGSAHIETIIALEAQVLDLKERFREQAEDSERTIEALLSTNREAIAKQEQLAMETQQRTAAALKAISEMKVQGVEIKSKNINLKKVVHGKVTKTSDNVVISKKGRGRKAAKVRDSGFVELLSDHEDDEVENGIAA
ncbi:hypothetical protein B0J11DRAFT_71967 [Dendryphion nanum]|uniref:Uncharacterized protein n=1 Tax=Dendryphion nanum TaxID=256645 RepID=A0A9P9IHN0_9PLEO|nr:hypothetical protein B0J11DRAFT_71967 [Dendryphion nanum]